MSVRSQAPVPATQTSDTPNQTGVLQRAVTPEANMDSEQPTMEELKTESSLFQASRFNQNFSRVPVSSSSHSFIQPKLRIGQPGDRYEQEADRVADQVMRVPTPRSTPGDSLPGSSPPAIQRLQQDDVQLQRQSEEKDDEEEKVVQTKASSAPTPSAALSSQLASTSGGQPLPNSTRTFMESRFQNDFSPVRVHTGSQAASMNRQLNARAFTHGQHIYFGQGQYQPHDRAGQHLLAHELTHVVQQTGGQKVQPKQLEGQSPRSMSSVDGNLLAIQPYAGTDVVIQRFLDVSVSDVINTADYVGIELPAGLVQLIRDIENEGGVFSYLEQRIGEVVKTIFSGLEQGAETASELIQTFTQLYTSIGTLSVAIISGDRQAFSNAVIQLADALQTIVGGAWDALETLLSPVGNFLEGVLTKLDQPIEEWDIWQTIRGIGLQILEWTNGLRDGFVWEQIQDLLDIPGSSSSAIMGWIADHANEAWKEIKEQFSGVISAIRATIETVQSVTSLDAIRAMRELVLGWIVNVRDFVLALNGDDGDGVVSNQDRLRDVLIPAIQAGAASLTGLIITAGNWVAGLIGNLAAKVTGFINSFRDVPLLSVVPDLFDWVMNAVNELSTWAQGTVVGLFNAISDSITYLTQFIEPVLNTLINLVSAAANPLDNLSNLISQAWNAIPEWIRNAIEDFVVNQILAKVPLFGQLFTNPEVWERVQATAMQILRQVFVSGDLRGAAWTFFQALLRLLEFPLELAQQIINKAVNVFNDIIQDPIGFFMNFLSAIKQGFSNFFEQNQFVTHLLNGVQGWLLGQAQEAGIQPPENFTPGAIFQFVLDVLRLNIELLWERLQEKLGPERVAQIQGAIDHLSGAWEWISIAINDGIGALWERIQNRLNDLWDQVLDGIIDWMSQEVIEGVFAFFLRMLDPTGIMAVVNSVIALYDTIQSAIQYFVPMLEIVNKVLDGIQGIISGAIDIAAEFLELAMADSLPVALGFIARYLGIDNIGDKLKDMVEVGRGYIVRAIDWLIDWALQIGGSVLRALGLRREAPETEGLIEETSDTSQQTEGTQINLSEPFGMEGMSHTLFAESQNGFLLIKMASERIEFLDRLISQAIQQETREDVLQDLRRFQETGFYREYGILSLQDLRIVEDIGYVENNTNTITRDQIPGLLDRLALVLSAFGDKHDIVSLKDLNQQPEELRRAVEAINIISFMEEIAQNGRSGNVSRETFYRLYQDTTKTIRVGNKEKTVREWLQNQFRNFQKGNHEWIPTVLVDQIVARASSPEIFVDGVKWIHLQNRLRSNTAWVVFKPSISSNQKEESIGDQPIKIYTILQGHPGAISFRGDDQVKNSNIFHDQLESVLSPDVTTISAFIDNLKNSVFEQWVLYPKQDSLPLLHPELMWNSLELGRSGNLQSFISSQNSNYEFMVQHFEEMKRL